MDKKNLTISQRHGFALLLISFFAFIAVLICCRAVFTGHLFFLFIVWNLFLAWVPYVASVGLLPAIHTHNSISYLLLGTWLLFFPNALYLVTDLIHLDLESAAPKWFDAILLFSAAVTGLLMAYKSLLNVERFLLAKGLQPRFLQPAVLLALFLGSFGVYLGRFLRWNSWDIIHHPGHLMEAVFSRIFFPVTHWYTWGVTLLLTVLFYLLYQVIKKLPAATTGSL